MLKIVCAEIILYSIAAHLGLLLLSCGGMHTVWGIYQVVLFDSSRHFRADARQMNATLNISSNYWIVEQVKRLIYPNGSAMKLTIIMWYVGIALGCFVAGWFLVRVVQKKNIYVSRHSFVIII